MFAIRDVNTRKLLQRYVYKTASARLRIEVYDATKIAFRTFHWPGTATAIQSISPAFEHARVRARIA